MNEDIVQVAPPIRLIGGPADGTTVTGPLCPTIHEPFNALANGQLVIYLLDQDETGWLARPA